MPRYKVTMEYDGREFVGWQRQANGFSVQQAVEEAVDGFCGEKVVVHGAGRTDSGVHARGQVAHFDLSREADPNTVRDALNFHLKPAPAVVIDAAAVDEEFHARFSATARVYRYRITNRRAAPTIERGLTWWAPVPLDHEAMNEAARVLIGHHDFTTFRATACQAKSPVKTLDVLGVRRDGDDIFIDARARSFLHHQVRNMAGTLKLVGEGKWSAADVTEALKARDRSRGGPTAPACGLYLMRVLYGKSAKTT